MSLTVLCPSCGCKWTAERTSAVYYGLFEQLLEQRGEVLERRKRRTRLGRILGLLRT